MKKTTQIDTHLANCSIHNPQRQSIEEMSSLAMRDEFSGDFSTIEEMDPSVADGFRVIYDREVCISTDLTCQT